MSDISEPFMRHPGRFHWQRPVGRHARTVFKTAV